MSASQVAQDLSRRHPLQKYDSPGKGFSGVVHVAGLISFYSSFKFLVDNPNDLTAGFGWHFQYLTIIGLAISTLSFLFGLAADITSSPTCFTLKNYFALVAAPIEVLISLLYWGLRGIDTSLVVPPDLPLPPFLHDLAFHLFPALLLTIDTLLLSPPWPTHPTPPQAPLVTLSLSLIIAFAYWFWIELCFSHNGFYPYPIFAMLSTMQRVGLFMASGGLMWGVGSILREAYAVLNGREGGPKLGDAGKMGKKE